MSFSTMWIASNGMIALGTGMQTISNNLANVQTVGFKTMRTNYEDLISQCYFSGGNHNQVGKGSKVATIQSMFTQGAFKASEQDTDMAIAGEGFFSVRHRHSGEIMYTRNGAYNFNKEGYLVDQSFNVLQGWQMSIPQAGQPAVRLGAPTDIQITTLSAPPVATTSVKIAANLNADDKSSYYYPPTEPGSSAEGPGYAGAWEAWNSPPMDDEFYSHAEPMTVYDEAGTKHTLMVYYQKNPHMENVWDYIITADPKVDGRVGSDGNPLYGTGASFAGVLQKGKITFSAKEDPEGHGGLIKSIEAENLDLGASLTATAALTQTSGSSSALSGVAVGGYYTGKPVWDSGSGQYVGSARSYTLSWNSAAGTFDWVDDQGGSGSFDVDLAYSGPYTFGSGLSVSFDSASLPLSFQDGEGFTIEAQSEQVAWSEASMKDGHFTFDFIVPDTSGGQEYPYTSGVSHLSQTVAFDMGAKSSGGATGVWTPDEVATTQYADKSSTVLNESDGYPESSLKRVYIREDGMVVGVYDQKREQELYQICLTTFLNPWGLDKKGDNLFAVSRFSGEGVVNAPGEGRAGTVIGNFLEQSNVDTATEIVSMILTQRGFQANSKAITTSDTMLATAIQLKR